MSNFIPAKRKLVEKVFPKWARAGDLGYNIGKMSDPKLPQIDMPKVPTIDEAQRERSGADRLRRRRGVLANIFTRTGGSGGAGSQTLGG